jgi:transcription-repair coupling factor (superfamily II helicase)
MVLVYQGGDKLKVPVESFDRVQKYASAEGARPIVDKLGSGTWEKTKRRVKKAMRDMAAELLKLYAERKARPGHAFTGESPWQREFEESFEYDETPDQAAAIADVMQDMSDDSPMDRLICGDVGYGKTEVAMRGRHARGARRQAGGRARPTTILAFQHWKTFRKRFAPSRCGWRWSPASVGRRRSRPSSRTPRRQGGRAHRHPSPPQQGRELPRPRPARDRRGAALRVAAKEKLKHMRTTVDCPHPVRHPIPRTLQMGLAGIRDMSVIETPPKDRLAIQTSIVKFSTDVIATAIRRSWPATGRSTSCTTAWSRSTPSPTWCRSWCRRRASPSPTADAGGGAGEGDARLRGGAGRTCS